MKRNVLDQLVQWKRRPTRKPLLVQGARQVGKTWAIKEFARREFDDIAYVDFLTDEDMKAVFDGSLDPERLLEAISLRTSTDAGESNVLVVLDEIQECPRALSSLKTFCERRPDVPIVAAGSLLGVALHGRRQSGNDEPRISFPVGKVDFLTMYPMTFKEYLDAVGESRMASVISEANTSLLDAFSERFTDHLRRYYFVGGMPEAVRTYAEIHDYSAVRDVQTNLLTAYELDFSKYTTPQVSERIRYVWQSLPSQLARENKKFIYSAVRPGARARGYEEAIQWLVDAGLALRVRRITKAGLPLSGYEDPSAFKLYLLDTGLLGAASGLDASTILAGNRLFTEFKGALAENYVCQALTASSKVVPRYWSAENSTGEVGFVYEWKGRVVPVEVKAEQNLRSKSLKAFLDRFHLERGIRLSLSGFESQPWMTNVPLYAAGLLPDRIDAAE